MKLLDCCDLFFKTFLVFLLILRFLPLFNITFYSRLTEFNNDVLDALDVHNVVDEWRVQRVLHEL